MDRTVELSVSDARATFSDVVQAADQAGTTTVLLLRGRRVAAVVPPTWRAPTGVEVRVEERGMADARRHFAAMVNAAAALDVVTVVTRWDVPVAGVVPVRLLGRSG